MTLSSVANPRRSFPISKIELPPIERSKFPVFANALEFRRTWQWGHQGSSLPSLHCFALGKIAGRRMANVKLAWLGGSWMRDSSLKSVVSVDGYASHPSRFHKINVNFLKFPCDAAVHIAHGTLSTEKEVTSDRKSCMKLHEHFQFIAHHEFPRYSQGCVRKIRCT